MTDNEGKWFLIPSRLRIVFTATLNYEYDSFDDAFGLYEVGDITDYNFKYPIKYGED